ncbi:MAG: hypothetical protein KKH98_01060 [Spirochaetes bacterium]|nr:hypothetical protein [Spirochaetota bacterium]
MVETMQTILRENMQKLQEEMQISDSNPESETTVNDSESVANNEEVISDSGGREKNPEKESFHLEQEATQASEVSSDSSDERSDERTDERKNKRNKNSLQERINAKHAELMQTKEALQAERQSREQLIREIAEIKAMIGNGNKKEPEEEELIIDDPEQLENYLKKVVTKDDLNKLVNNLVDEKLKAASATLEKQSREQSLKQMQTEFYNKMVDYYNPDKDPDYYFEPEIDKFNGLIKVIERD